MTGQAMMRLLDDRRKELGWSFELLSKRSGVSRATVQRILAGDHGAASFANVLAIAEALGLEVQLGSRVATRELRNEQAKRKARSLVGLVQGTSGLEGQAVDQDTLEAMIEQTTHELLAGPKRRLWSDS